MMRAVRRSGWEGGILTQPASAYVVSKQSGCTRYLVSGGIVVGIHKVFTTVASFVARAMHKPGRGTQKSRQ